MHSWCFSWLGGIGGDKRCSLIDEAKFSETGQEEKGDARQWLVSKIGIISKLISFLFHLRE
jgi:hypothetical protein